MGYTHYLTPPAEIDPAAFRAIGADVRALIAALPATAPNGYTDEPAELPLAVTVETLDDDLIAFNGAGPVIDGRNLAAGDWPGESRRFDLAHEDFWLQRVGGWMFCKTARKPYDVLVTAALLSVAYHVRAARVKSDGDAPDWAAGVALWRATFPDRALPAAGPWVAPPAEAERLSA